MSYTPTTWATGDTITAEKLNHAEQGIAAAVNVLFIETTNGFTVLNKTYKEIHDAIAAGTLCIIKSFDGEAVDMLFVRSAEPSGTVPETYGVMLMDETWFVTDNENGYPVVVTP